MATPEQSTGTAVLESFGAVSRVGLTGVFTGVESVALVVWLALVEGAPVASRATVVGLTFLVAGLVLEHVLTDIAVNGIDLSFPYMRILGISVSETLLWALWLVIAESVGGLEGFLVAAIVLATLLVPQHTIEDNVLRGRQPLSRFVDLGTVGFSVVEAAGSTVWLFFVLRGEVVEPFLLEFGIRGVEPATVGIGILASALFIEHVTGVMFSSRS